MGTGAILRSVRTLGAHWSLRVASAGFGLAGALVLVVTGTSQLNAPAFADASSALSIHTASMDGPSARPLAHVLVPGLPRAQCTSVVYGGERVTHLRLFGIGTPTAGSADRWVSVTIESRAGGPGTGCLASNTWHRLYQGTLAELPKSWLGGLADRQLEAASNTTATFRVTYLLAENAPQQMQGRPCAVSLTWEARAL
jgi:hypothetical protein